MPHYRGLSMVVVRGTENSEFWKEIGFHFNRQRCCFGGLSMVMSIPGISEIHKHETVSREFRIWQSCT